MAHQNAVPTNKFWVVVMKYMGFQTVLTLTNLSERTMRRRIADGSLETMQESGRTLISVDSVKADFFLSLKQEDIDLIEKAENNNADAQTDLALFFLEHDKAKSALYWLELAIKKEFPDAMHLLGYCYLRGEGVTKDYSNALMWIAKAASIGHKLAIAQIAAMNNQELTF